MADVTDVDGEAAVGERIGHVDAPLGIARFLRDPDALGHGDAELRADFIAHLGGDVVAQVRTEKLPCAHPCQVLSCLVGERAAPLRVDREEALEAAQDGREEALARVQGRDHVLAIELRRPGLAGVRRRRVGQLGTPNVL